MEDKYFSQYCTKGNKIFLFRILRIKWIIYSHQNWVSIPKRPELVLGKDYLLSKSYIISKCYGFLEIVLKFILKGYFKPILTFYYSLNSNIFPHKHRIQLHISHKCDWTERISENCSAEICSSEFGGCRN